MKAKCPACSTTYSLPDDTIGSAGRKVKCAKCSEVWFVTKAEEKPPVVEKPEDQQDNGTSSDTAASTAKKSQAGNAQDDIDALFGNDGGEAGQDDIDSLFDNAGGESGQDDIDALFDAPSKDGGDAPVSGQDDIDALFDNAGGEPEGESDQDDIDSLFDSNANNKDDTGAKKVAESFFGPDDPAGGAGLVSGVGSSQDVVPGQVVDTSNRDEVEQPEEPAGDIESLAQRKTTKKKKSFRKPASPIPARYVFPIAASFLLVALLSGAFGFRHSLVRTIPDLAGLYALAGMDINLRGLQFRNVRTSLQLDDGVTTLLVEGEIENVTNAAVDVPPLRLSLHGYRAEELYSWSIQPSVPSLEPGRSVRFRSRIATPPGEAAELEVRFSDAPPQQARS